MFPMIDTMVPGRRKNLLYKRRIATFRTNKGDI
jgi:hypothetical protein